MSKACSCSYSAGALICGRKSVARHHLSIKRLPRWFFEPLFHWVWELDGLSVIKEKQLPCKHSCVSSIQRKWFVSACSFLSACPSRPNSLLKTSTGGANSNPPHSLVIHLSISLRGHLHAWFKHSYREFRARLWKIDGRNVYVATKTGEIVGMIIRPWCVYRSR